MVLDKWDLEVIRYTKTNNPSIEGIREIWARRCGLDIKYVSLEFIVFRLIAIVLYLSPNELPFLLVDTHPTHQWKFGLSGQMGHWENWLRVLCSRLRLTEVSKIPGY